jgi:hypothetical protein
MNQDPGGTAPQMKDSTQYGNNGTSTGMTSANKVTGQVDGATSFDGGDNINNGSNLFQQIGTQAISVSAWVKLSDLTERGIIGQYDNLSYYKTALWYKSNQLFFEIGSNDSSFETKVSSSILNSANTWYQVVGTYDKMQSGYISMVIRKRLPMKIEILAWDIIISVSGT